MNKTLKIWTEKTPESNDPEDQYYLKFELDTRDDLGDIFIVICKKDGKKIDDLIAFSHEFKCFIKYGNVDFDLPIKTDVEGSVIIASEQEIALINGRNRGLLLTKMLTKEIILPNNESDVTH